MIFHCYQLKCLVCIQIRRVDAVERGVEVDYMESSLNGTWRDSLQLSVVIKIEKMRLTEESCWKMPLPVVCGF